MANPQNTFGITEIANLLQQTKYNYYFRNHFHPFVEELIEKSNKGGIEDVLMADLEIEPDEDFFENRYDINTDNNSEISVKKADHPHKEIDLSEKGAYSIYNWEIFFHIPLSIAVQLSKNQRFADAQRWFHFIFDPTTDTPPEAGDPMARYWNFLYFRENGTLDSISEMLETLSSDSTDADTEALKELMRDSITAWKEKPFSPHTVAKTRPLAYKYNVVMKYLDNLIDWGDSLFRQFTMESINEATQIYLLASSILGEKPQEVPALRKRPVRTYNQLKGSLDEFSNALVEMENEFPLNTNTPSSGASASTMSESLLGIGKQLYFCVPKNDKLLAYWDKVADRLAKIRHCMDIEGNIRPLPLFQPPIDPGMLVKGAAAGIDLSSLVGGLNQPVSNVRFRVIYQKALELCNELRLMGKDFLSALEKGDNEKLSLIRQEHQIKMNELISDIRFLRWKEAEENTESLLMSRASAFNRYKHYQLALGKEEGDISDLSEVVVSRSAITEDNFDEIYSELVSQYADEIDAESYREENLGLLGAGASGVSGFFDAISATVGVGGSSHLELNKTEDMELNVFMPTSTALNATSAAVGASAVLLSLIPQVDIHGTPLGVGAAGGFGGVQLSKAAEATSRVISMGATIAAYAGQRAGKLGGYQRRVDDWVMQSNASSIELQQIGRRLIGSLINEQALKKEFENHGVQTEQSQAIEDFLKNEKFTTEELYLWMQGELSKVYYDCYKMAHDTAKKAETTMKHELMRPEVDERDFIKFNYWDTGRKGLLSGEGLMLDLKRMDLAYTENNKREFEITKHVSLRRLNPHALLQLKTIGSCEFNIPEWVFDLGCPGHYMRRIKTVSLSIPCVTGPYTGVNCTLSLQKSTIRTSSLLKDGGYEREEEDDRFKDNYGAIQSIVTSNAQNDSGMFNPNFNDERYLPFEGAGAESTWRISLPADLREFDYNTISDVILHVRYTSRQGGELLAEGATEWINTNLASDAQGSVQLLSLKHDFPNEWYQFNNSESGDLTITVSKDHLPYLVSSKDIEVITSETKLYELNDDSLSEISNPFDGLTSAFELDGDTTRKEITIQRSEIEGKDNVVLLFAYGIA